MHTIAAATMSSSIDVPMINDRYSINRIRVRRGEARQIKEDEDGGELEI
jgi:hypothetical protein